MTTHTTLSAARQAGRKDRPRITGVLRTHTPPQITAFLIANLELELIVSDRKTSPLKIPNRKFLAIFHFTVEAYATQFPWSMVSSSSIQRLVSSLQNPWPPSGGRLIETPRLEFPATTTKLSPLPIPNRDKTGTFVVAVISHAPHRNSPLRSPRPKTFSPSTAVLDFAQQFCSEENFSATTANRWNFGLCATIPREPRQARKGATVTGQLRVPRNTRSSSLAPGILRAADENLLMLAQENRATTTLKTYLPPIRRSHHSEATSLKSRVADRIVGLQ